MCSFRHWCETQRSTLCAYLLRFIQVLLSQTSLYLILQSFYLVPSRFLMNQSSDLWLQEFMYIFIFMWSLPPPDWAGDCLSSSTSTANALFSALLAGTITFHYCLSHQGTRGRQQPTVSQAWEFSLSSVREGEQKMPPQICHVGIRLILSWRPVRRNRDKNSSRPSPSFPNSWT